MNFTLRTSSGDTDEPEKAAEKVKEIILGFADDPEVSETNLDLLKKKNAWTIFPIIKFDRNILPINLRKVYLAIELYFDLPEIIDSIQMKDVLAAGEAFISEEAFSEFYMRPK